MPRPDPSADLPSAADVLARHLHAAGCRRAWGMPGGEVLTLVDALERAGIEVVLARHENAAAFMAEGDWHMTGAPALLVATLGPGILNAVNAIANAFQDRVPLIALSGCVDESVALWYSHQVVDHQAVLAPVTKASLRLTVEGAALVAERAVSLALAPRPGPVHVDVPISVAGAPSPAPSMVPSVSTSGRPAAAGKAAPPAGSRAGSLAAVPAAGPDRARSLQRLAGARRPLIIAGRDVVNEGGAPALPELATKLGAPVITTYGAKGVIDEHLPLSLGAAGLSPLADSHLLALVRKADVIVCAGYDSIEMRGHWRDPWDPARTFVIDIASAPDCRPMHRSTVSFVGHVGASLAGLAADLPQQPGVPPWPDGEVAATRAALERTFARDEPWGAAAVIDELERACPPEATVTVDSGAHRILLSQMWRCRRPRSLLQSSAFCTMGPALPLAIGARRAMPERPVVAVMGDAGFFMVAGELSTAQELGLPLVVVVLVDGSLALIEKKQRARQLPSRAVAFRRHDVAAIARAFGGRGLRATSRAELAEGLHAAFASPDTMTVIAAEIPQGAYDGRI